MPEPSLTPQEYEQHLVDLRDRIRAYFDTGEGSARDLEAEARKVFALANEFREVFDRHEEIKGLVGGLLARRQQEKAMGAYAAPPAEARGCMLGWLLGRRKA